MNSRKKTIFLLILIIVVTVSISIVNRENNKVFYNFQISIKNEFESVHKLKLLNNGPYCTFMIYMKEGSTDFNKVEAVFLKMMLEISKPNNLNYFMKHHGKVSSGELAFFHITFKIEGNSDKILYQFISRKNFEKWKFDGKEERYYYVADYINKK